MKYIILMILSLGLTACGGGGGGGSKTEPTEVKTDEPTTITDDPTTIVDEPTIVTDEPTTITGVAATGLAVAGAKVTFSDKEGNPVETTAEVITNESGNYSAEFTETPPTPLLIVVETSTGEELKSILDDASQTTVNINPVTSFVADQVIEADGLASLESGDFAEQGQIVVEQAFGDGVQFDAFASDDFVAKTSESDETTQPSPADVLLDALADVGEQQGVEMVIQQAMDEEKPLLQEPEFQVEVAKVLAEVETNEPFSSIIDSEEGSDSLSALAVVDTFTGAIESKIGEIETQLVDAGLTAEQIEAVVDGVIEIATEALADTLESVDTVSVSNLDDALDNSDELFVDDLVEVVTDDAVKDITGDDLVQVIEDTTTEIVTIVQENDIDLSVPDTALPTEVESEINDVVETPVVIVESNVRWNEADWDELVWQ